MSRPDPSGQVLAEPIQAVTISGGVTGGAITFLALTAFVWLVFTLVKKDKLRISHIIAVTLAVVVFTLTPLGQLAFGFAMGALDDLAALTA